MLSLGGGRDLMGGRGISMLEAVQLVIMAALLLTIAVGTA